MSNCRVCGAVLTSTNWWKGMQRHNNKMCNSCNSKKTIAYRKNRYKDDTEFRGHECARGKRSRDKLKLETFIHYSGTNPPQCANLFGEHKEPYTTIAALTIDHIDDNGAEERERIFHNKHRAGIDFYRWLRKNGYPEGYQVLCFNCQWIKRDKDLKGRIPQLLS